MMLLVDAVILIIAIVCLIDVFKVKKKINDDLEDVYRLLIKTKEKKEK